MSCCLLSEQARTRSESHTATASARGSSTSPERTTRTTSIRPWTRPTPGPCNRYARTFPTMWQPCQWIPLAPRHLTPITTPIWNSTRDFSRQMRHCSPIQGRAIWSTSYSTPTTFSMLSRTRSRGWVRSRFLRELPARSGRTAGLSIREYIFELRISYMYVFFVLVWMVRN